MQAQPDCHARRTRFPDERCWGLQVDEYVAQHFGFAYSFRGWVVLILLGFVVLFRVGSIVAVTKLSYVKR